MRNPSKGVSSVDRRIRSELDKMCLACEIHRRGASCVARMVPDESRYSPEGAESF
ncbi:hypothetical protein CJ030_MR4G010939 [Morella rubra]|uniref:Uncharacterized protein n=1 Tax=Morella rubra TaxID=262757 RepID=A0A6A1VVA0_9ROSI|nr:hypothetical protein CJ030_MR4G010939 [Morella rubra]